MKLLIENNSVTISPIINFALNSFDEYREYSILMIEEADYILNDRCSYIKSDLPYDIKLMKLDDLIDFFILEEEDAIVYDLVSIKNALILKRILSGGSIIGYI